MITSPLPALGLVCVTASDQVRFRTLTRKRLLQLDKDEQLRVLGELYLENLRRLDVAVDYCLASGIRLYRLSSALFPFADELPGSEVLERYTQQLREVGGRARRTGLRLVIHPDQYVVLNSDDPAVIANAVKVLVHHARVLDLMGLPRSPWALMEIHGGKANRSERLVEQIARLPDNVRLRLGLENDEYTYRACEIYEICRQSGVPMVFDAHHHVVAEQLTSYDEPSIAEMLALARSTWPVPEWQLVHISNGAERFNDRRHSDLIAEMPKSYRAAPWIEVEAKAKELAIEKLECEWLGSKPMPRPVG